MKQIIYNKDNVIEFYTNLCCSKMIKYSGGTNGKVELGQGVDEGMGEVIMARIMARSEDKI